MEKKINPHTKQLGVGIKCKCADRDYSDLLELLKVIAEANRLKIICLLKSRERCVCEIVEALGLPHNLASHHLKVLTKAGILLKRKEGRYIHYKINRQSFSAFKREFDSLTGG